MTFLQEKKNSDAWGIWVLIASYDFEEGMHTVKQLM